MNVFAGEQPKDNEETFWGAECTVEWEAPSSASEKKKGKEFRSKINPVD